ncbi:YdaU family protein [Pseudodesulfovibrio tunisiensis]|uniref:YdaU family protein n=1 Tax=Pseudodesulfovibrio tunisiensis TaxID=463192 RepID=UPI001FB3C351|nr:YdaU family protein [Pseudodesulfovibrio tunisiensis]
MAKKKAPAFQFYVRDWLSEPEVRRLSLASRGIWIDILAYMWLEEEQGKLEAGIPELARMCGASESEIEAFLREAERVGLCSVSRFCPGDVPACPENVQLVSRRMHREWKDREMQDVWKRNREMRKAR